MYLTRAQRHVLQRAASEGIDAVNNQVLQLRTENPQAFHSADSLRERVFFDKPVRDECCLAFFRTAAHDPFNGSRKRKDPVRRKTK